MLRSLAVILVFIDHASLFAGIDFYRGWDLRWIGDFGVYLFFVHTCLVLMWSLERRPHTLDFYVRRIFRIYPLAFVVITGVALTHFSTMYAPAHLGRGLYLSNILLIQNVWKHPNIIGVLWSLPLELQMYLLLPMLFIFARRERAIWPFLIYWGFACVAAYASYGAHMGNGLYAVVPHFLPGIIAYIGYKHRKQVLPAWTFVPVLLILLVLFELQPRTESGWFLCLAVGLLLPLFKDFTSQLVIAPCRQIAKYSYGIYLLHPIALYFGVDMLWGRSIWLRVAVTLGTLIAMVIPAYHLVEAPFIKLGGRYAQKMQACFGTDYAKDYGLELT